MKIFTLSTTAPPATGSKNLALVAMLLAVAMTFIDQTIVAIAAPNIQSELSLSQEGSRPPIRRRSCRKPP